MSFIWIVLFLLWIQKNESTKVHRCAEVKTSSARVRAGSAVSAWCHIDKHCPLATNTTYRLAWRLNNKLLPSNLTLHQRTHRLEIPHLERTTDIVCCVFIQDHCQTLSGATVDVGYPPLVPQNLSCVLNLTDGGHLWCRWDPGSSLASATYSLHTKLGFKEMTERRSYNLSHGERSYTILKRDITLFSEMEIHVTASNLFGNSTSATLILRPMESAKLEPPEIHAAKAGKSSCLNFSWSLSESQRWLKSDFHVELKVKAENDPTEKEASFQSDKSENNAHHVCGLLHGTNYSASMRVKHCGVCGWSDWSDWKEATTKLHAPSGFLDTWLKVKDGVVHLYWKPSLQFRANGYNVLYVVESVNAGQTFCVTPESHCSFTPVRTSGAVCLRATNAAGSSDCSAVRLEQREGLHPVRNVSVLPSSASSLSVWWEGPVGAEPCGYVLEWTSLLEKAGEPQFFTLIDRNHSSADLTGLRPYEPYELSVYPRYTDGVGRAVSVMVYTQQREPTVAPEMSVKDVHSTHVSLFWDEVPLKDRNGIILGYSVYLWNDSGITQVMKTRRGSVMLKNLHPLSTYRAVLSVHTMGGTLNGSAVTFKTGRIDDIDTVPVLIPACVGIALLAIFSLLSCVDRHKRCHRLKTRLWPMIPDPANSSIKTWTNTDALQGLPTFREEKESVLVYVSRFSLLDASESEQVKSGKESGSYGAEPDRDSVPYATVMFSAPYQRQAAAHSRSDSTQPLLDQSGSPPPYQNLPPGHAFTAFLLNPTGSPEEEAEPPWEHFPLLRTIEINDSDR